MDPILNNTKQEQEDSGPFPNNSSNVLDNPVNLNPKKISYGDKQPYYLGDTIPAENDFMFKAIFGYGEYDTVASIPQNIDAEKDTGDYRKDPFSGYRSGLEMRTCYRGAHILISVSTYTIRSLQLFCNAILVSGENTYSRILYIRQPKHTPYHLGCFLTWALHLNGTGSSLQWGW